MNNSRTLEGGGSLQGIVEVPGDKSISHRALINFRKYCRRTDDHKWLFKFRRPDINSELPEELGS